MAANDIICLSITDIMRKIGHDYSYPLFMATQIWGFKGGYFKHCGIQRYSGPDDVAKFLLESGVLDSTEERIMREAHELCAAALSMGTNPYAILDINSFARGVLQRYKVNHPQLMAMLEPDRKKFEDAKRKEGKKDGGGNKTAAAEGEKRDEYDSMDNYKLVGDGHVLIAGSTSQFMLVDAFKCARVNNDSNKPSQAGRKAGK